MLETNMARWEREWQERSEAHGRAEGELCGLRASLLHILERRFGAVDEAQRDRIAAAQREELMVLLERVVEAPSIDRVFAD